MNKTMRLAVVVWLLVAGAVPPAACATDYSLWIKGRGAAGAVGNYDDFSYWGPASSAAGINKKAVNWDGYNSIASQNGAVRAALDSFCTGPNWCYIAAYSAGDPMIGYALANFGRSTREVKNAAPAAGGQCGNAGGTQTGWNIKWVRVAAGAAGGSEVSDAGSWTTGEPLVRDLRTTTVRAMYNHNETAGLWFYMYAGARNGLGSFLLPGEDDGVVAYHSAGAVSGLAGNAYCNPGAWFCNDLNLGTQAAEGGRPKWSNHSVEMRDDGEWYGHSLGGNWQGIGQPLRQAMETYAR